MLTQRYFGNVKLAQLGLAADQTLRRMHTRSIACRVAREREPELLTLIHSHTDYTRLYYTHNLTERGV